VGTAKRERQKVGRQGRRAEAEAAAKRARNRSALIRYGILAVVILGLFGGFAILRRDNNDNKTSTSASTTTAAPTTTAAAATYGSAPCPPEGGATEPLRSFDSPFMQCIDASKSYTAVITTSKGEIKIALDPKKAPVTVNNFVSLARWKFYDGLTCHRIIPDFVVQCGDPQGTGSGGPGYKFADELPQKGEYKVGSIAMANSGPNTNGSQFFIITGAQGAALDPNYSLFGQAADGQDQVIAAFNAVGSASGTPKETVTIQSVKIV
jgi:cyclophilin family peptidyl-prolyl cis-trans isomerase